MVEPQERDESVARRVPDGFHWPAIAAALVILGLLLLAMPSRWEGGVLLPISPGHALSALDVAGVVPLIIGMCWIHIGLWQRRERLWQWLGSQRQIGAVFLVVAGFGLGTLLASVFSQFFWWWAVGAVLFATAHVIAVWVAARR